MILDEGWAVNMKADLMQVVDAIDIKELVDYAAERNVGIILWAVATLSNEIWMRYVNTTPIWE